MDGTDCGGDRWCVGGYCEPVANNRRNGDGLSHNERAGGWGEWGRWGDCSRTCGTGVAFRSRSCNSPRPAYGGEPCHGEREEYRTCNVHKCLRLSDFRAEQCRNLFDLISFAGSAKDEFHRDTRELQVLILYLMSTSKLSLDKTNSNFQTWYPYEHDRQEYKCKLTCYSRESEEYYQTGENVIDGTRCSYDDEDDICVQGKCVRMGCDMRAESPVAVDACGVCGGDGSACRERVEESEGTAAGQRTKVVVIPREARRLSIQVRLAGGLALVVKERNSGVTVYDSKRWASNNTKRSDHEGKSVNYGSFITEGTKLKIKPLGSDEMVHHLMLKGN